MWCSMYGWGTLLERGLRFVQRRRTRNSVKQRDPFVHGRMESPNTSPQSNELNPSCRGKFISTGLALILGIKTRSLEVFSQYSAFHLWFVYSEARTQSPERLFKIFCAAGTNERLDLSLTWRVSEDPSKRPYNI